MQIAVSVYTCLNGTVEKRGDVTQSLSYCAVQFFIFYAHRLKKVYFALNQDIVLQYTSDKLLVRARSEWSEREDAGLHYTVLTLDI